MNIHKEIIQFIFSNPTQMPERELSYLSVQQRLEELILKEKHNVLSFEEKAEMKYLLILQSLVRIAKGEQFKLARVSSYENSVSFSPRKSSFPPIGPSFPS